VQNEPCTFSFHPLDFSHFFFLPMLVIRLQRTGRENNPAYRVCLSERTLHAKKGQKEIFGHYLPALKKPEFVVDTERIVYWISMGAQPSETVARLLKKNGVAGMEKFMSRYTKRKSDKTIAAEAEALKAEAAAKVEAEKAAAAAKAEEAAKIEAEKAAAAETDTASEPVAEAPAA
jgi:small subunit ribosomal protein S16